MNDRFKFRVWDKQKKSLIDNCVIYPDGTFAIFDFRFHEYTNPLSEDDGYVLEQCTGLRDKEGKLIFEGDVLEKIVDSSCYKTSDNEGFYLYKKRKKNGLIVEEKTNDKFNEIYYFFRTGENDVATMDRFPCYWLKNESFGWEGEELETPENWVIIGNIHESEGKNE